MIYFWNRIVSYVKTFYSRMSGISKTSLLMFGRVILIYLLLNKIIKKNSEYRADFGKYRAHSEN